MEQADFDKEFARFQAGARVLAEAAAEDPALAARLAAAMDAAVPDAAAAEQQAQEAARANALRALNDQVRQTLAAAANGTPPAEPASESDPEPEGV